MTNVMRLPMDLTMLLSIVYNRKKGGDNRGADIQAGAVYVFDDTAANAAY